MAKPNSADEQRNAFFDPTIEVLPPTECPATASNDPNQDTQPQTVAPTQGFEPIANGSVQNPNATLDFNPELAVRANRQLRGTMVGGYEIQSELGRGGMGVVYKAYQRGLDRTVALKMVLSGAHASEEQLRRFIAEAKAVGHLQHPNIVQVFDIGECNDLPFFSLEFVDGPTLSKSLRSQPQLPSFAASLSETLSRAIAYAHDRGILHRDLKPANILMTKDGVPKIADFGLAKQIENSADSSSTRTGTIMGTPSYMAPEQASGDIHAIGPASDQYSLGAILYELLTGRPPFVSANPMDTVLQVIREEPIPPRLLATKVPVDLETICLKALQKNSKDRYPSCLELADDLQRFRRGEPIVARPVGYSERLWRWCKRNPVLSAVSATALGLLLAIAAGSTWFAVVLSQKNVDLANKTKLAQDSANVANEKTVEANRRSDRLKKYIQDAMTEVTRINVVDNPGVRDYVNRTYSSMLPLLEEIIQELPETEQAAPTRANGVIQISKALREQGHHTEAESKLRELVAFGERRLEIKGHSDAARVNLAKFLVELASVRLEVNRDFAEHLALLKRAEGLAQDSIDNPRKSPDDGKGLLPFFQTRSQLADIKNRLATAEYRIGNPHKAMELYMQASDLYQQIVDSCLNGAAFLPEPEIPIKEEVKKSIHVGSQTLIANISMASSVTRYRTGDKDAAMSSLRRVLASTKQQHETDPASISKSIRYIGYVGILSELESTSERANEFLQELQLAAKLADQLVNLDPLSAEIRRSAAVIHYRLGQWRSLRGIDTTLQSFQRCLDLRKEAASTDAKNDRKRLDLMLASAAVGNTEIASRLIEEFVTFAKLDNEMRIDIARSASRLSGFLEPIHKLQWEDRATNILKEAIDAGYSDPVYLESELDFYHLREKSSFRELVQHLQAIALSH